MRATYGIAGQDVSKRALLGLQAHFSAVTALSVAWDGWTLLTAGRDKVAVLWDLRTHARLATIPVFEAIEGALLYK